MKRRLFIQNTLYAAGSLFLSSYKSAVQNEYKLVMVRGGSPGGMLDVGIEILGGANRFLEKGQTVLVKPTMQWDRSPETGANTNPDLLRALVERLYKAGSKGVYLMDQTHDRWTKCYKNSGIERAVKDAGAKILPADKEFLYQEVEIPGAKVLKKVKIHQAVLETDLIINVPAVKPDSVSGMFGAFQNLTGLIWDDGKYRGQEAQCYLDLLHFRKPVLNIMDMYRVPQNGTTSGVNEYKTLILSADIVAAEFFTAKRLGIGPNSLKYIELAEQAGFGQTNPPKASLRSIILKNSQT